MAVAKGHVFKMEIKVDVGNFLPREMERPGTNKHTATDQTDALSLTSFENTLQDRLLRRFFIVLFFSR